MTRKPLTSKHNIAVQSLYETEQQYSSVALILVLITIAAGVFMAWFFQAG